MMRRSHNRDYGGLYFSQLPEDVRLALLNYELSTDLLVNVSDGEVLDIFSRLNSHAVVLNPQEKINASHFGEFRQLADALAHEFFEYWIFNRIMREAQVMRMQDVSLTADLLIAMCDGIQSKKQIPAYYAAFENDFPYDSDALASKFRATMAAMSSLYPEGLIETEFRRVHLYYSLFTTIFGLLFDLPREVPPARRFDEVKISELRFRLDHVDAVFVAEDPSQLPVRDRQFLNDSRRATTDAAVRRRRTQYLTELATTIGG